MTNTSGEQGCPLKSKASSGVTDKIKPTSYTPVIAVFGVALLLSASTDLSMMTFMGYSLTILATLKLMDIPSFHASFKEYDLLTSKVSPYGYAYPFLELFIGLSFVSSRMLEVFGALSVAVGLISLVSIVKVVFIDRVNLDCACVGGNANVPLGIVSIAEALMMIVMGLSSLYV